jgi:hypothetical protein
MNTSSIPTEIAEARAQQVSLTNDALGVDLVDGRTIAVPLTWYPRLAHGSPAERWHWRLISEGEGIHLRRLSNHRRRDASFLRNVGRRVRNFRQTPTSSALRMANAGGASILRGRLRCFVLTATSQSSCAARSCQRRVPCSSRSICTCMTCGGSAARVCWRLARSQPANPPTSENAAATSNLPTLLQSAHPCTPVRSRASMSEASQCY